MTTTSDDCTWTQDASWDGGPWDTSCGNAFEINEGKPSDNHMKFCCYCGKPLIENVYVDSDDHD